MQKVLLVPIQVNVTLETQGSFIIEPQTDFSKLPHRLKDSQGYRDINSNHPYTAASVATQPFQGQQFFLRKGVHLHWVLPEAYRQSTIKNGEWQDRKAPNRWLVSKTEKATQKVMGQWVVESDYLFPDGQNKNGVASCILNPTEGQKPYRFMGRNYLLQQNIRERKSQEYYPKLTAFGDGNPLFNAFYPNCASVFGFFDESIDDIEVLKEYEYDVLGWHHHEDEAPDDTLVKIQEAWKSTEKLRSLGDPRDEADFKALLAQLSQYEDVDLRDFQEYKDEELRSVLLEKLKSKVSSAFQEKMASELKWTWEEEGVPDRIVCYSRMQFEESTYRQWKGKEGNPYTLSVANTGMEALSASLAAEIKKALPDESKRSLELQLDSVQLDPFINRNAADRAAQFKAARHERTFNAMKSGHRWELKVHKKKSANRDVKQPEIPDVIHELLARANALQRKYNQLAEQIETKKKVLFADWYKYIYATYPPRGSHHNYPEIDEIRSFIEHKGLRKLKQLQARKGELGLAFLPSGKHIPENALADASHRGGKGDDLSAQLNKVLSDLLMKIKALESEHHEVFLIPGSFSRYWIPKEPVILLSKQGNAKEASSSSEASCRMIECTREGISRSLLREIRDQLPAAQNYDWQQVDRTPLFMDWEVQYFASHGRSNLNQTNGNYGTDFITSNYEIPIHELDITLKPGKKKLVRSERSSIYSGRSMLNGTTAQTLEGMFDDFVESHAEEMNDFTRLVMDQAREVLSQNLYFSQSLNGFNESMLMYHRTFELPVRDPLGFRAYQSFTEQALAPALGDAVKNAPSPANEFNPIRSGCMKVRKVRLVYGFGNYTDVNCETVNTPQLLQTKGSPYLVSLPARLMQPARLDFRWLAAESHTREMDQKGLNQPICGWLIPNFFDQSLMIYDAEGSALGAINLKGQWEPVPGRAAIMPRAIENSHLRIVVAHLMSRESKDPNFIEQYLSCLESALDHIQSDRTQPGAGMAFWMGRPLAVVRAKIDLQIQGEKAVNHDWNNFRRDLSMPHRTSDKYTQVKFPVKVGEYNRLNDGLAGYWIEDNEGALSELFYAQQSDVVDSMFIDAVLDQNAINCQLAIDDPPLVLTMLMDVHGSVHANAGILPVKAIDIPEDQYKEALQQIEISFLVAPVLNEHDKVRVPVQSNDTYEWTWVQREDQEHWKEELSIIPVLEQKEFLTVDFLAQPGQTDAESVASELWEHLHEINWLRQKPEAKPGTALVASIDQIRELYESEEVSEANDLEYLKDEFQPHYHKILQAFDQLSRRIESFDMATNFSKDLRVKEGWLKLKKHDKTIN